LIQMVLIKFVVGVDDSDSDKLKVDTGATVGGATALEVASDKKFICTTSDC